MAIYPDKKNGVLNGRWRVELQRGTVRYRKRWDSHADAVADEKAVLAAWATGDAPPAPGEAPGAPEVHTLASVFPLAKGTLWDGQDTEVQTWQRMDIIAKLLGPNTRLDAIDTQAIDGLRKKLKVGRAPSTVNRFMSHLKTFLEWARGRKYRTLPVTGDDGISFSWSKESAGRIRWITRAEQSAIGEYLTAPGLPEEASAVWELVQIALVTGCRRDELITVELGQINGTRLHLWETKTDTPRTLPLTPEVAGALRSLVTSGRMPTRHTLWNWWEKVREHMGLKDDADFVFHACRHTCATRMVEAGVNIAVIQKWMGHKRIETTLRYAHVQPTSLEDALLKVGDLYSLASFNSQFSATPATPTAPPTGGEMPEMALAA